MGDDKVCAGVVRPGVQPSMRRGARLDGSSRVRRDLTIEEGRVLLPDFVLLVDEPLLHLVGVVLVLAHHPGSCAAAAEVTPSRRQRRQGAPAPGRVQARRSKNASFGGLQGAGSWLLAVWGAVGSSQAASTVPSREGWRGEETKARQGKSGVRAPKRTALAQRMPPWVPLGRHHSSGEKPAAHAEQVHVFTGPNAR